MEEEARRERVGVYEGGQGGTEVLGYGEPRREGGPSCSQSKV